MRQAISFLIPAIPQPHGGNIVLARRASVRHLRPKPSKITTQDTNIFVQVISENVNFKHIIEVFPPKYNSHDNV